jgi:hypothetical protein
MPDDREPAAWSRTPEDALRHYMSLPYEEQIALAFVANWLKASEVKENRVKNFPWFGVGMTLLALMFISVCVFLVVREQQADDAFRRRCAQLEGFMLSDDGDQLRVCVDRDKRVILTER